MTVLHIPGVVLQSFLATICSVLPAICATSVLRSSCLLWGVITRQLLHTPGHHFAPWAIAQNGECWEGVRRFPAAHLVAVNSAAWNASPQTSFDDMYNIMRNFVRSVLSWARDNCYLRWSAVDHASRQSHATTKKKRLMRAGRIEEADAVARRVHNIIARKSSSLMRNVDTRNVRRTEGSMGKCTARDPRR